jgi:RHS repeat-associated protein
MHEEGNARKWRCPSPTRRFRRVVDGILTTKTYDGANRVTSQVVSVNGATVKSEAWTFDGNGNTLTYTDAANNTTTDVYDSQNNLIQRTKRDGAGTLLFQLAWEYDPAGNQIGYTDGNGNVFVYGYDPEGNKISQVVHDRNGNLVDQEAWVYDGDGNEISHTWNDGNVTTSTYDGDNRLVLQVTANAAGTFLYQETWVYDDDGNLLAHTDPMGRETTDTYDALGNKLSETAAYGTAQAATTVYTYDDDSNMLSLTDPVGNETTFGYDAEGNRTSTTDPLNHIATATFDPDGRMTSSTDVDGRSQEFTYDANGRLLTNKWYDAAGTLTETNTFTYDADGNMLTASNSAGTYIYHYNGQSQLVGVDEPFGLSLAFAYDTNGNRILVQDSLGGTVQSTYDWANRLVSTLYAQTGKPTMRVDQAYDWDNRVEEQTRYSDAAGTHVVDVTAWSYDAKSEVIEEKDTNGTGDVIADYHYQYDAAGEETQQIDHGNTANYTYDDLGQLTGDGTNTNSYDPNGNRTNTGYQTGPNNELLSDGTWNYSYDEAGNETKKVNIATEDTWTYGYDDKNELIRAQEWSEDPAVVNTAYIEQEIDYKYDPFGNRLEEDATTYSGGTGTTVETRFGYDGWNPAKPTPTGNENFDVWADLNGSNNLETRYVRGDLVDQLFGRVDADGNAYWTLSDKQGTIRDVVDSSGAVKDSIQYDTFGNIIAQTDPSYAGRYAWTGREFDVETDLQYNHARYYDAATGRWMSQDPLGFDAGDSNLYRYVKNSPAIGTDPTGLWEIQRHGNKTIARANDNDNIGNLVNLGFNKAEVVRRYVNQNHAYKYFDDEPLEKLYQQILHDPKWPVSYKDSVDVTGLARNNDAKFVQKVNESNGRNESSYIIIENGIKVKEVTKKAKTIEQPVTVEQAIGRTIWFVTPFFENPSVSLNPIEWWSGELIGAKAIVNSGATMVVDITTFGMNEKHVELIPVSAQDRAFGYDIAAIFGRIAVEILGAKGMGKLAQMSGKAGQAGKALIWIDQGQNLVGGAHAAADMHENGLTLSNGAQLFGHGGGAYLNHRSLRALASNSSSRGFTLIGSSPATWRSSNGLRVFASQAEYIAYERAMFQQRRTLLLENHGPVLGGNYRDVRVSNVGGDIHHMPADSVSPLPYELGPGIWMPTLEHAQTASFANTRASRAYRTQQAQLINKGRFM